MHRMARHQWIVFSAVVVVMWAGLPEAAWAQATRPAIIRGQVVDAEGEGMPFVNVQLTGTTDGAATKRDGRFEFSTRKLGAQQLQATMIGFETAKKALNLAGGDTVTVELTPYDLSKGRIVYRGRT